MNLNWILTVELISLPETLESLFLLNFHVKAS